ncbi:MAG: rane protein [Deinococcus sp.]|jgi:putative tricarboxylic transport membrane protein|nr:rane protein [Deinococcus sp.]
MPDPVPPAVSLPSAARRPISVPDLLVALGVVLLGLLLLIGTNQIATSGMNTVVGPRVFPLIVSVGTLLLGILLTIGVLRGHRAEPAMEEDTDPNAPVNLAPPGLILGGFLLGTLLLQPLGFVVGTAVMYFTVAFAFGERRYGLMAGVAVVVALITYLLFTRGLGLTLPAGILKGVL